MHGGELFDYIVTQPFFQEKNAVQILRQVFKALCYLHSENVIHRDVKPENIFLERVEGQELKVKIIEFGNAIRNQEGKSLLTTVGTPYYIAPEVLKQYYDAKCDVWSAGVLMYILLSGKPPFDGNNNEEILKSVLKGEPSYSE